MNAHPTTRRLLPELAALLALALPAASPAQNAAGGGTAADTADASPACCLRASSPAIAALDRLGTDADETFFMSKPAPPNVMFVLDTSGSMQDLPIPPENIDKTARGNGCEAEAYDAILAAGGFSMSGDYPPPDTGVSSSWNGDPGFPSLFLQDKFYRNNWWDEDGATSFPTAQNVCADVPQSRGGTAKDGTVVQNRRAQCEWCVANKGYYLDTGSYDWSGNNHQVFSGKFLNFYPPKFVVARTTLKQVIWDLRQVRFALTVFNGESGGKLLTKMSPSCSKALDPEDLSNDDDANAWTNSRKSAINTIKDLRFSGGTPLAETLLDVGQFFTTKAAFVGWFGNSWWDSGFASGQGVTSQDRSFCWGCQVSAMVTITDGAPCGDNCVPKPVRNQNVTCTGCDQQDCGPASSCPITAATTNQLDDVTRWFSEHDLQTENPNNGSWSADGRQRLIAYNVGFGLDHPLLRNAAEITGGRYYTASDGTSLKAALLDAIADINRRATAFGISSISTLQTTSANASASVPRFIPDQPGQPWKGMLYRFNVVNEFVNGCKPTAESDPLDPLDVDGDHRCASLLYADADGDLVEEDPTTGAFMKRGKGQVARPIWEAGRELTYENPTYSEPETAALRDPDSRSIWTAIDTNGDGRIDAGDEEVEFTAANAEKLMPYLQISADITRDSVCSYIADVYGIPTDDTTIDAATATETSDPRHSWGKKCAAVIIEYYRGRKSLDLDPAERSKTRPWLLGDIFHSSPVVVEPPISPEACQFFKQQCVSSLFSNESLTGNAAIEAYRGWLGDSEACGGVSCEKRRKILLVGANDGFLHAFDYGEVRSPETREQLTGRLNYDDGTGQERWAFIPPDLLGSLKHTTGKHAYYVDGTAMVRDVWVDAAALGSGDGERASNEFHTVAIVGERTGGSHFFALDVTRDVGATPANKPSFLWTWPQPCDPMTARVGESLSNFVPKPPPIMPVLLDAESTGYGHGFPFKHRVWDESTRSWKDKETRAQERWVVMLNGGYDKYLARGRGVSMVDAWTGDTLWDAFYEPEASDLRSQLLSPVPAGVAMLDIGSGEPGTASSEYFDGFVDTALFGDMGGNLWVTRLYEPGKLESLPAANGTSSARYGKVSNWPIARAFQTERGSPTDSPLLTDRRPISYIVATAMQPNGYVRAFFGTGDRNGILETLGGRCTLDNLSSCIQMGCKVESEYLTKIDESGGTYLKMKWDDGKLVEARQTTGTCSADKASCKALCSASCTTAGCAPESLGSSRGDCEHRCDDGELLCSDACGLASLHQRTRVRDCPATTEGPDLERDFTFLCSQSNGQLECKQEVTKDTNSTTDVVVYKTSALANVVRHRFFGVHVFGGKDDRVFYDAASAADFDAARLTETSAGMRDLGALSSTPTLGAAEDGEGWLISYDTIDEKTASAAGVSTGGANNDRGCVIWNSVTPGGSAGVCAASGSQAARLIQADYVSGLPNCAVSFESQRFLSRSVLTPPAEPTQVLMIANGRISYGMVSTEPGAPPQATISGVETDLAQAVYTLELTPQEHLCRHVEGQSQQCAP